MLGLFRRPAPPSSPELGVLGTQAFVVTDWEPGPTTWRPVLWQDGATEPLRRTRTVKGPLVFKSDQNLPLFQGESTPAPAYSADVTADNTALERFINSLQQGGYPS